MTAINKEALIEVCVERLCREHAFGEDHAKRVVISVISALAQALPGVDVNYPLDVAKAYYAIKEMGGMTTITPEIVREWLNSKLQYSGLDFINQLAKAYLEVCERLDRIETIYNALVERNARDAKRGKK